MRGLTNFITECLNCPSKELEKSRVNKELHNIRKNFGGQGLNGYNRKKYIAKLLYIHLLGYQYDFGFPQMIELLASNVFSEKQIGYITLGVVLNGNYELVTMLIEHFRKEIKNFDNEPAQCLAIAAAANIGGNDIAVNLSQVISQTLNHPKSSDNVKKTACLALCRLYKESSDVLKVDQNFASTLVILLNHSNIGVQLSAASFVQILLNKNMEALSDIFPVAISQLNKYLKDSVVPEEYIYGKNPVPWLSLKFLRILQKKSTWEEDEKGKITRIVELCLQKTDLNLVVKEINSNMILLFESINLVIAAQLSPDLVARCTAILGGFLSAKQSNIRYMAIETLTRLVLVDSRYKSNIAKHRETLYIALRDPDSSIRRRTLSLLYAICDHDSSEEIVKELLNYLKFADISMREPLCLKIAVLAEQYAQDPAWFVDVVIQLISLAGDECNDGIWYRVVQVVSNNKDLQRYAAKTTFNSLVGTPHNRLVCLASQLVGDYSHLMEVDAEEMIDQLITRFKSAEDPARGIIMSALAKIAAKNPNHQGRIVEFFNSLKSNQNIDIQQRAIEYSTILHGYQNAVGEVFKPSPPLQKALSSILKKIQDEQLEGKEVEEEDNQDQAQHKTTDVSDEDTDESNFVTRMPSKIAPPQQPPVQRQESSDDLLEMVSKPVAAPQKVNQSNEILPLDDLLGPTSFAQPQKQNMFGATPAIQDYKSSALKRFLTVDSGAVFEDECIILNLGINTNSNGIVIYTFTISNKYSNPISNVTVHIPPYPSIRVQSKPGPSIIQPGESPQYQFAITPVEPFYDSPPYVLRYRGISDVTETLQLPCPMSKFASPLQMDHATYFQRWGSITANNQNAFAKFQAQIGADIPQQMRILLTGLFHVSVLQLNVPANNACGAGSVKCENGIHGFLVRFYEENGQININVKGTSPTIATAFQKMLDFYFK